MRLRVQLMDSLLAQDVGFFDVTKTGDITSRLSSDTTLVGDQITLNVNVFLRSVVQAIGVLIFMFVLSWQLTIIAFISVPVVTALSKWVRILHLCINDLSLHHEMFFLYMGLFLAFASLSNTVWELPS